MIKLVAALFMIIDSVGVIFFPYNIFFTIFGRFSMPLFGYCIARGFYYSEKEGKTKKYLKNLLIFSIVSQIPFNAVFFYVSNGFIEYYISFFEFLKLFFKNFIFNIYLNIGFTWTLSIILLKLIESFKSSNFKNKLIKILLIILIVLASVILPLDYGLFGVLMPLVFYFCYFKFECYKLCTILNIPLYLIYVLVNYFRFAFEKGFKFFIVAVVTDVEYFYFLSVIAIYFAAENDFKILPKRFFYFLYPIHFIVLLTTKILFFK